MLLFDYTIISVGQILYSIHYSLMKFHGIIVFFGWIIMFAG